MKEMTDRELTDRISQVFEDFDDPNAAQGWQELRKKYPENNTRTLLLWWGAAAAVLLIVGGLWFGIPRATDEAYKLGTTKPVELIEEIEIGKQDITSEKEADRTDAASSPSIEPLYRNKTAPSPSSESATFPGTMPEDSQLISTLISRKDQEQLPLLRSAATQTIQGNYIIEEMPLIALPKSGSYAGSHISNGKRDSAIDRTAEMLALAPGNPEKYNQAQDLEEKRNSSGKTESKKNSISFYAGSYFNYSLGSETKLNFGAGFTQDIKLASNLKLSTGLALANNSLTYNDGLPSSSKEKLTFDALPSFSTGVSGNNNLTTITRYDASLLALDIPINLKYLIIPKDNKLYLLAGLSSGTYLAETYSLDYRNYSPAGSFISQSQGIEVKKQLQAFDLARTLNISFGYSANLGKTQNITVEPFLKYPLGGLGSEDLKFGSTGINLKLNFSQFKKR